MERTRFSFLFFCCKRCCSLCFVSASMIFLLMKLCLFEMSTITLTTTTHTTRTHFGNDESSRDIMSVKGLCKVTLESESNTTYQHNYRNSVHIHQCFSICGILNKIPQVSGWIAQRHNDQKRHNKDSLFTKSAETHETHERSVLPTSLSNKRGESALTISSNITSGGSVMKNSDASGEANVNMSLPGNSECGQRQ